MTALSGITATKTGGPHAVISQSVSGNVLTLVVRTGTYGFTVSATGQRDGALTFTAPLGSGVSPPSLTLKREKVTLTLTDSAITPAALAGATVTMDVGGTPVALAESVDTPGTYQYAGLLAAGTYTITASASASASGYDAGTVGATVTNRAQVAKSLALHLTPPPTTTTTTAAATTTVAVTTTTTTAAATTTTTAVSGTTTTT